MRGISQRSDLGDADGGGRGAPLVLDELTTWLVIGIEAQYFGTPDDFDLRKTYYSYCGYRIKTED